MVSVDRLTTSPGLMVSDKIDGVVRWRVYEREQSPQIAIAAFEHWVRKKHNANYTA